MSTPYDLFDYTNFWEKRSFEDKCERIVLGRFFGLIDKKNRLIDIGGGFGRLASIYAPIFSSCTVLEPSIKQIEIGKKKFKAFSNLSFAAYLRGFGYSEPQQQAQHNAQIH